MKPRRDDSWLTADPTIVEILGGLLNIVWGLWLGLFNTAAVVRLFLDTMTTSQRWTWAIAQMLLGVAGLLGYARGRYDHRVVIMSINALIWCFIFAVFVISNYRLPATPVYLIFLLMFGWAQARMRQTRRDRAKAPWIDQP